MTRKTGRFLFAFFVIIFLVVGITAVLYSFGYRINFENLSVQKTGGIYIKTQPRNVIIKISDQNRKEKIYPDTSSIIQSGTLIQNLLPKTYKVSINKEGYNSYLKTLKVSPSRVSELLNITLIPKTIVPAPLISVRGETIIDSADNAAKFIIQNEKTGIYYLYNTNDPSKALNINALYSNIKKSAKIKNIAFIPFKPDSLIIEDSSGLEIFDTTRSTLTLLVKKPVLWTLKNSSIYFVKTSEDIKNPIPILSSYNLVFQKETNLIEIPKSTLTGDTFTAIKASSGNDKVALQDELGSLYLFNQTEKNFKKIASNVKSFDFSPSNELLAYLSESGQLNILFLKDYNGEIARKSGDVIKLDLPDKELIKSVVWHESSFHLLIEYPQEIDFTEVNNLPPLNTYKILNGAGKFFYDLKDNGLFFIKDEKLQKIDFDNL